MRLDYALMRGIARAEAPKRGMQLIGWSTTPECAPTSGGRTPYGLLRMASLSPGLVSTLTEFGLVTAVVSLRTLDAAQLDTLWLLFGVAGALVTCAAAWPLAWIYRKPPLPCIVGYEPVEW